MIRWKQQDANGSFRRRLQVGDGTGQSYIGLLGQLRKGDVLIVWKLDRLSRSLKDVLTVMEKIDRAGLVSAV